jgi:hypothetical protein
MRLLFCCLAVSMLVGTPAAQAQMGMTSVFSQVSTEATKSATDAIQAETDAARQAAADQSKTDAATPASNDTNKPAASGK